MSRTLLVGGGLVLLGALMVGCNCGGHGNCRSGFRYPGCGYAYPYHAVPSYGPAVESGYHAGPPPDPYYTAPAPGEVITSGPTLSPSDGIGTGGSPGPTPVPMGSGSR